MEATDSKLLSSLMVKGLVEEKLNRESFEKIVTRVLLLKSETQARENKRKKKEYKEDDYELSSHNYTKFLEYFQKLT